GGGIGEQQRAIDPARIVGGEVGLGLGEIGLEFHRRGHRHAGDAQAGKVGGVIGLRVAVGAVAVGVPFGEIGEVVVAVEGLLVIGAEDDVGEVIPRAPRGHDVAVV